MSMFIKQFVDCFKINLNNAHKDVMKNNQKYHKFLGLEIF